MNVQEPHSKKRWVIIGIIIAVLVLGAGGAYVAYATLGKKADSKPISQTTPESSKATEQPSSTIVHVSAMGDMLAHDTINSNAKTASGYDYVPYFANIRPAYTDSDVVFCNQEGLSAGEAYGISGYPTFNAPTQFSVGLQTGAGCNLINLANNHMGDKGVAATNATIDNWTNLKPLAFSGANKTAEAQNQITMTTVKGVKIGFVSFSDFNNNKATPAYSVNIYHDTALVKRLITELRAQSDIVIVSMHWGTEDSSAINADQKAQVTLLASLGVDVIIGTGPHVLQKVETVPRPDGGKLTVWYSIGNMLSSQLNIEELVSGIAGFDIEKPISGSATIKNLSFIPTYMHYEWTAEQKANNDLTSRRNVMLYLLKDATVPLSKSLFNTTIDTLKQYVVDKLANDQVTFK